MNLRLYLCPVIGDGVTPDTAYRAKVARDAPFTPRIWLPKSGVDGAPWNGWCLVLAMTSDWAAADADADLKSLFGIDLPDTITTKDELKAFLQSKTVGDIPAIRRAALNTRLTEAGFDTSQVTLSTTWWQVFLGIMRQLDDGYSESELTR